VKRGGGGKKGRPRPKTEEHHIRRSSNPSVLIDKGGRSIFFKISRSSQIWTFIGEETVKRKSSSPWGRTLKTRRKDSFNI